MKRFLPAIGVFLVFSMVGVLVFISSQQASGELSEWEHKRANASKVSCYLLTKDTPVRFDIGAGNQNIKVSSHAVIPNHPFDPERRYRYGLEFSIVEPGGIVSWNKTVWLKSRQSKADWTGTMWRQENAFDRHGDIQITDTREILMRVPQTMSPRAKLEVHNAGGPEALLIRAYIEDPRSQAMVSDRIHRESTRNTERIQRATYLPWVHLSDPERLHQANRRFRRLAAEGKKGENYLIQNIYLSNFSYPNNAPVYSFGDQVSVGQSIAYNVMGPEMLTFEALQTSPGHNPHSVNVEVISATAGSLPIRNLGTSKTHELNILDGLSTIRISTTSSTPIQINLRGVKGSPITPVVRSPIDERDIAAPAWRRLQSWIVGPEGTEWKLPNSLPNKTYQLRIVMRALQHDGSTHYSPTTVKLLHQSFGHKPLTQTFALTNEIKHASYERSEMADGSVQLNSEPIVKRVKLRPGDTVTISADSPVAVTAFLPKENTPTLPPELDIPLIDGLKWRYALSATPGWSPLLPQDPLSLRRNGKEVWILAQTRLEPSP